MRNTVDLVVIDTVPLIFTRTYRNRDGRSRAFGIGTNHSYGSFLIGDAPAITYIDLVLPDGGRIHYERTSGGTGAVGAVFEHTSTPSTHRNSRLFWNGGGWTIQLRDGSVYTYPACPPSLNKPCTVSSYRDPDGTGIRMRHDRRMNLVRVETDNGAAIDLTYDSRDRIVAARSSDGQEVKVKYEYDRQGRLVRVTNASGVETRYGYDDRHQMVRIDEPGRSITNAFDDGGRCILNDIRTQTVDGRGEIVDGRSLFTFAYTLNAAGRITATDVERPTGRRRVTFNSRGSTVTDTHNAPGAPETGTAFDRNEASNVVQRLTVWCGPPRQRVKVEALIEPEGSPAAIRRRLEDTCASVVDRR